MGRLAGFRHKEIARRLKACGFEFDRQAAGSHEIWFSPTMNRYTTIPDHPGEFVYARDPDGIPVEFLFLPE